MEEGAAPILRVPLGKGDEAPLHFERAPSPLTEEESEALTRKESTPAPESLAPQGVPPVEQAVERASVKQESIEARKESAYAFMDELVDIKLDAFLPRTGENGYFRLRIIPKEGGQIEILPKAVTFVVDASGSITQTKLNITRKGLQTAVGLLRPDDRFNITVFRETAEQFRPELIPATEENKAAAKAFFETLRVGGETDVYSALKPVVQGGPRPGTPSIVFIISDGRATVGLRDARAIINGVTAENNLRNSVFAFGGGETVNHYLMDLLAYRNKGESAVCLKIADIEKELPRFAERFNEPILVNLRADYGHIDEQNVFPRLLPDFFKGKVVTVYGRFEPAKDTEFVMRLTGAAPGRTKELIFRADLKMAESGDKEIAHNWAFQKAYDIIGQMSRLGETPELLGQLRELKQKYGVTTSYDQ